MIVPGLDRIEGTAVSPQLLNNDELWHEHTMEILELLEEENGIRQPDERVSMLEFCRAYASGERTTRAMRRATASKDWSINKFAVRLLEMEADAKRASSEWDAPVAEEPRRRKGKQVNYIKRSGTKMPVLAQPSIVLVIGAGYPYDQANAAFRKALQRFRSTLSSEGFYISPDNSCHVTLGVIQRLSVEPTEVLALDGFDILTKLRRSPAIQAEMAKGPIELVADRLEVPDNADTIVLLFKDPAGRVDAIREALRSTLGSDAPHMTIPSIIHSSLARVASFPGSSRSIMLQRLEGIFEGMKVTVDSADLVIEDRLPFLALFPDGSIGHWELGAPTLLASKQTLSTHENNLLPTNGASERSFVAWIADLDRVMTDRTSILMVAVSLLAVYFAQNS